VEWGRGGEEGKERKEIEKRRKEMKMGERKESGKESAK
jgi:hypothetical protein